jgi:hypothetical protein
MRLPEKLPHRKWKPLRFPWGSSQTQRLWRVPQALRNRAVTVSQKVWRSMENGLRGGKEPIAFLREPARKDFIAL